MAVIPLASGPNNSSHSMVVGLHFSQGTRCYSFVSDLQKLATGATAGWGNLLTVRNFGGLNYNKSKGN